MFDAGIRQQVFIIAYILYFKENSVYQDPKGTNLMLTEI